MFCIWENSKRFEIEEDMIKCAIYIYIANIYMGAGKIEIREAS